MNCIQGGNHAASNYTIKSNSKHNGNINGIDSTSPLLIAIIRGKYEITKYFQLILFGFSFFFLQFISYSGDEKMVETLIKNGSDIEEKTKEGMTPLLLAAFYGNFHITLQHNNLL